MCWTLYGHDKTYFRNYLRITSWLGAAGAFWILGGMHHDEDRILFWCLALSIEYLGPAAYFWTPWLGRSTTADWKISGEHMAERCGLFIIIALGESILVTGSVYSKMSWNFENTLAFVSAFIGTIAMWWIYFNIGAEKAAHHIAHSNDPGRIGRIAYSYIHLFLVAGIILTAVSDEIVLMHPEGYVDLKVAFIILGGPALYLLGNFLFKASVLRLISVSHIAGLFILISLFYFGRHFSPINLHILSTLMFVIIAMWETVTLKETS